MNYWLHRNTGGDNALPYAQVLLDKGFMSIGWSAFSTDKNLELISSEGWKGVDKIYSEYEWEYARNRYCLSRFISEMKKGDLVIIPTPGKFGIYEVYDDDVYSNESIEQSLYTDANGIPCERINRNGYFVFLNSQGYEIDLGFYRRVKPRLLNQSRYDRIAPELYAKMRNLMTNINITDVGHTIDNLLCDVKEPSEVHILPSVLSTEQLFSKPLSIPIYQRPYVWSTSNVEQMLDDIRSSMVLGKESYRLGSIILHENNIVDGQQRITTLALIRRELNKLCGINFRNMCDLKYNHTSSFEHLRQNDEYIRSWITKLADKNAFAEYLEHHCKYVVLEIACKDGLSMAFKLFDSQNGRGKSLEAYNLLKAFHIRAMDGLPEDEKIKCDRRWELATRFILPTQRPDVYDILKHLFDEQLYRSRLWARNGDAWSFSKKRIGEFKGMDIDRTHIPVYPFQNRQMLLCMTEKFYHSFLVGIMPVNSRFKGEDDSVNPFTSISQPIVNGKDFFEYIQSYTEIYKKMFLELDSFQLKEFKEFYKRYCIGYNGHWRTGDNYVREMYKSMVFYLFDKFGEDVLNRYYKILYLLSYILRRQNSKVFYQTVAKYPHEIFAIISGAKSEADLVALHSRLQFQVSGGYSNFPEYEEVVSLVKEQKYE